MSNERPSDELSEARRQALDASVAPGADIHLSYEETEAFWSARDQAEEHGASSVTRSIRFGVASLSVYTVVTHAAETQGVGVIRSEVSIFGISPLVIPGGGSQVPAGQAQ
jgi:hypothetical protein